MTVTFSSYSFLPKVTGHESMTIAAFVAEARGVHWDRVAWAWRAQDGAGASETFPTWSEATAWLEVTNRPCYAPEGETVDLSTFFPESWGLTKAPRKARKRKGKRK